MFRERYDHGDHRSWIRTLCHGHRRSYCLAIMAVITISNALAVFFFSVHQSPNESDLSPAATFILPPLGSLAPGCSPETSLLPDPEYEIDANNPGVLKPNSNYDLIRLPEWDHVDGSAFYVRMQDVLVTGSSLKAYNCHIVYFGGGCAIYPDPYPMEDVRTSRKAVAVHIERAIIISQHFGYAYYHWMIEALPRLVMMYDVIQSNPSLKLVMFSTEVPEVGPTVLNLLDVDPNRVVWYNPSQAYYIRDVMFPSPAQCGIPITTALKALKSLLRNKLIEKFPEKFKQSDVSKTGYKILIQDRGQARRSLLNHAALVEAIMHANPDAQIVVFGPRENFLSMAEKHFNADLIIGPHGAGLSNVIFAPNGAVVVEIHPNFGNQYDEGPHFVNSCHQRTARRTGLRSFLLLEDNGDVANAFNTNITRVLDTVAKIRAGDFDHVDHYASWQLKD